MKAFYREAVAFTILGWLKARSAKRSPFICPSEK